MFLLKVNFFWKSFKFRMQFDFRRVLYFLLKFAILLALIYKLLQNIVWQDLFFLSVSNIHMCSQGVIHFLQIDYFGLCCRLHLTSAWLCMYVVLVIEIQWPICTKITSMYNLLLDTYPFSMSYREFFSRVIYKIVHYAPAYGIKFPIIVQFGSIVINPKLMPIPLLLKRFWQASKL